MKTYLVEFNDIEGDVSHLSMSVSAINMFEAIHKASLFLANPILNPENIVVTFLSE